MATLVIRFPDGTHQEQVLTSALTIGRSQGNDVVLPEGGVSRHHARFFVQDGKVMVEDAGSANGTFVDGDRIEGPTRLSERAQVSIGDYEVSVKSGRQAAATTGRPKAKSAGANEQPFDGDESTSHRAQEKPRPRATKMVPVVSNHAAGLALAKQTRPPPNVVPDGPILRGLTGPWLNKVFPLHGMMAVGRSAGVEIHLDDDSVSRRHAELEERDGSVVLRDLGSANGTLLNGDPVSEEMELVPGDIIQFGVLEVAFENRSMALAPRRRAGLAAVGSDTAQGDDGDEGAARRKRLMRVGLAVATVLVLAVMVKVVLPAPPAPAPVVGGGSGVMPIAEEKAALELALSECRQYLNPSNGAPDLNRAEKACYRAVELEPIHPEANDLKNKYLREKGCGEAWVKGQKELQLQREEAALQYIAEIKPECAIYFKVKTQVLQAMDEVKRSAGADCRRYNNNGNYAQALPRCEQYMKFACQTMTENELRPPMTGETSGGKEWRPKDPLHAIFLKVRKKIDPTAPSWSCPPIPILQPPPKELDRSQEVRAHFAKRIKDADVLDALVKYWKGQGDEAVLALAKIREKPSQAPVHALADSLRNSIGNVMNFLTQGRTKISLDKHFEAESPFREALRLDEGVVFGDEAEKMNADEKRDFLAKYGSYFQRTIQREMGEACDLKARDTMEKKDPRAACKLWKLGYDFYRGSMDLTKGVTFCTGQAAKAFPEAKTCEDLDAVLTFAVEGDTFREKVAEKRAEWKCK